MIVKLLFAAASAALLAQAPAVGESSVTAFQVDWTATPAGEDPARIHLGFTRRSDRGTSQTSRSWAVADLPGLAPALDSSEGAPVRFRLAREAGTLDCEGVIRSRRGAGTCGFAPAAAFAAELQRRGIGRPDAGQAYMLTLHDAGTALLDELQRQGYARPTLGELVGLAIHGATPDYLRGLDAVGVRAGTPRRLTQLRIHGVTPAWVGELAALDPALARLGADDLVRLRIHGVTPAYVRAMAAAGYGGLSADDLVRLRIHGVTPEDARRANRVAASR